MLERECHHCTTGCVEVDVRFLKEFFGSDFTAPALSPAVQDVSSSRVTILSKMFMKSYYSILKSRALQGRQNQDGSVVVM